MGRFILFPDRREKSAYQIDYEKEKNEGIKGILFDIDNTLVPHDAPATDEAAALFQKLHEMGFKTCIISNNGEARVKPFAEKVNSPYIFKAGKPLKKGYLQAAALLELETNEVLFLGDQILTDVCGAKNVHMKHALVDPIDKKTEPFNIKLKRILENILLFFQRLIKKA